MCRLCKVRGASYCHVLTTEYPYIHSLSRCCVYAQCAAIALRLSTTHPLVLVEPHKHTYIIIQLTYARLISLAQSTIDPPPPPPPPPPSFLVDLRKGVDDFMGRAFYLLGTIPSKGERKTLELYSHSAKSKLGSVKVDLRIRGMREGLSEEEARTEHLRLTRAVVDSESRAVSHTYTHH